MELGIKFTPNSDTTITVSDLINILKEVPADKPVYVYNTDTGDRLPISVVDTSIGEYTDINISNARSKNKFNEIWYTKESPSEIRAILESLPCPISTDGMSYNMLSDLICDVDNALYQRFGTRDITTLNEYDLDKLDEAWWEELEHLAIGEYGLKYMEDVNSNNNQESVF